MIDLLAQSHPFLVHFAVALSITSTGFDLAHLLRPRDMLEHCARLLGVVALPFLVLAAVSGNAAGSGISDPQIRNLLDAHETWANVAIWTFTVSVLGRLWMRIRKNTARKLVLGLVGLSLVASVAVFFAAKAGGEVARERGRSEVERVKSKE